jgi:hypothetical protein
VSEQAKRKPRARRKKAEPPAPPGLRDRIVELRRVPAAELEENDKNWRVHPYAQQRAVAESLDQVGIADALIAYHSKRNGGKLTLIDGHERRGSHEADWPVLILDVTDEEADLLLLTLDPMTGMADTDGEALRSLLAEQERPGTPGLEDLLLELAKEAQDALEALETEEEAGEEGPPEMELQTFEHYDYVVFLFRDVLDWRAAKEQLGLRTEAFTLRDGKTRKVGLGRVLDGKRLLELLQR